ncbi:MAG: hypothetical protein HKN33_15170 [Pyrinomonadaceae bacterium]|nr:hypothetical protein [Pyrinomonadaceae bacterium]
MKTIKRMTGTLVVLGVIMMGASSARAGLVMSDFTGGSTQCTERTDKNTTRVDRGIIVTGLTTIFGKTIVDSVFGKGEVQTNCGIIVTG